MNKQLPVLRITLAIWLSIALLAASLPTPAQAANCVAYYFVKAGDTTVSIAQAYGLKWREIAKANKLEYPYKLKVGQRLCIPPEDVDDEEEENKTVFKLSMSATRTVVNVTVSGLKDKAVFAVKMRNASTGIGGWYKVGVIRAKKNTTNKYVFAIPKDLSKVVYLQVCLKNSSTDELTCKTLVHP